MGNFDRDLAAIQRIPAIPTILDVIRRLTDMRFVAIARVTEQRWIACATRDDLGFGLDPGGELAIETTICHEIRQSGVPVIIDDVSRDPRYVAHPTPAMYGFKSYISMPIVLPGGSFFGTLCAIDPNPASLNRPEILGTFKMFAELIGFHLDMHAQIDKAEAELASAKEMGDARERFVAVLGHDLRNPLASIKAGLSLLSRTHLDDKAKDVLGHLNHSTDRMGELIENLLDLARGRLGGGLPIRPVLFELAEVLHQVVREIEAARPNRIFNVEVNIPGPVMADPDRIGQLVSNLVSNAVKHGAPDTPIRISGIIEDKHLVVTIANEGNPIPPSKLKTIFEPFNALETRGSKEGLGLGLYIASEISRAHGGTLSVSSTDDETRFTFRAPIANRA
ncbi:GAF domain-containing sensor histidine kinase [Hyphomicrobium sp.]|mgnify:FL=1|uniref:GAF domain-containing sensor histidine kinase n=1 Tax=Hyphomicrobium sp. TaxID=82 RepID=UPI002BCF1C6D|nr:GAF domain-containing sensor histidine kinase [Hyphomicrobium sp.]HRN88883.1 GAF domain-containing sensor histidine kinase [Hyphomicrobium sp.]HRQ27629.1 GAF domain-containing sensor histidine kinase [Hyphomicrobium sp.]